MRPPVQGQRRCLARRRAHGHEVGHRTNASPRALEVQRMRAGAVVPTIYKCIGKFNGEQGVARGAAFFGGAKKVMVARRALLFAPPTHCDTRGPHCCERAVGTVRPWTVPGKARAAGSGGTKSARIGRSALQDAGPYARGARTSDGVVCVLLRTAANLFASRTADCRRPGGFRKYFQMAVGIF